MRKRFNSNIHNNKLKSSKVKHKINQTREKVNGEIIPHNFLGTVKIIALR